MRSHEQLLRALADPTRRQIFERLRSGPRTVGELAADLPVSRPAVSQHLKVLKDASMVRERRQGTRSYYSIDARALDPLRRYLEGFWDAVLDSYAAAVEEKTGGRDERGSEN
jgi:DNA-binding transcriptional ArsR family regulator